MRGRDVGEVPTQEPPFFQQHNRKDETMKKLTINNREDGQDLANALLLARSDPPVGKCLDPRWVLA